MVRKLTSGERSAPNQGAKEFAKAGNNGRPTNGKPAPSTGIVPTLIDEQIEFFLHYLNFECGLADATIVAYRRDLREFAITLEVLKRPLPDVTYDDLKTHLKSLDARKLAVASIARRLAAIKVFLRFLHAEKKIVNDVAHLIESPKRWRNLPKAIMYQQVDDILQAPDPSEPFFYRDQALLELLYASGMRVHEVAAITLKRINLDIGYCLCIGKGNKERVIPIGREAREVTGKYIKLLRPELARPESGDTLLLSRNGKPLDRTTIWRLIRKYAERAGVSAHVTPHTMRHSFATHLLAGGADIRVVQELLGHADVTTTEIYTLIELSGLQEAHRRYHPRP